MGGPILCARVGDDDVVRRVAGRLGVDPVPLANPYSAEHALTFQDPDGFRVVLAPEPWPSVNPACDA
jgi:hypothetical protein